MLMGCERKPAAGDRIEGVVLPKLPDDGAQRPAAQCLLHRAQNIPRARNDNRDDPLGTKPDFVDAGAVEHTALDECHVLGDPQHGARRSRLSNERQRKQRRGRHGHLAGRRDLVQGARQAAAQRGIYFRMPERAEPGCGIRFQIASFDAPDGMPQGGQRSAVISAFRSGIDFISL